MAVKGSMRPFLSAVKLGWAIDSNWTSPLLFGLYSVVRPLSSCMILVVMYLVVTGGKSQPEAFAFMYIGNAFYILVSGTLAGLTMTIHVEREHYQTMKYVYLAMSNLQVYLCARALSRIMTAAVSVVVTLLFGIAVFHLPVHVGEIDIPLLALSLALGMTAIVATGLLLAGVSMTTAMHNFFFGEAVGSLFFLLSGVLFPLSALPPFLQKISLCLPLTYWMELVRRALVPSLESEPLLAVYSTGAMLIILASLSVLMLLSSTILFSFLERLTRKRGTIDMTTAY